MHFFVLKVSDPTSSYYLICNKQSENSRKKISRTNKDSKSLDYFDFLKINFKSLNEKKVRRMI